MGRKRSGCGRGLGLLALYCLTTMNLSGAGARWASTDSRGSSRAPSRTYQQECSGNEDCPLNYCCTVGMMRYSEPTCTSFGRHGDPCIPDNEQRNFSLSFPNMDESLQVIDSYSMFCPCSDEFYCDRASTSCEPFDSQNNILTKSKKSK